MSTLHLIIVLIICFILSVTVICLINIGAYNSIIHSNDKLFKVTKQRVKEILRHKIVILISVFGTLALTLQFLNMYVAILDLVNTLG